MFICSRDIRRLFGVVATLFLAAGAEAQDPPRKTPTAATLPIPAPISFASAIQGVEKTAKVSRVLLPDGNPEPSGPLRIDLPDAQARAAAAGKVAELAKLNLVAARYHRQAAQADYFPKIGATFANLHFDKFMGQEIALRNRTAEVPLLNKNQSLFAVTVMQPVTPLFKVHEAVQIARADQRIAQARADAVAAQVAANVEHAYLSLLIAQSQLVAAEIKVKLMNSPAQIVNVASTTQSITERQGALLEATKAVVTATSQVTELTQSLNTLMGLPLDTQLELADPPPLIEQTSSGQLSLQAIDKNPEVVEAQETLAKARAASHLSKLDYVPDVAGLWGYSYQTAIPLLPRDFSFVGFMAS
jgi:outer membrane protein TolC